MRSYIKISDGLSIKASDTVDEASFLKCAEFLPLEWIKEAAGGGAAATKITAKNVADKVKNIVKPYIKPTSKGPKPFKPTSDQVFNAIRANDANIDLQEIVDDRNIIQKFFGTTFGIKKNKGLSNAIAQYDADPNSWQTSFEDYIENLNKEIRQRKAIADNLAKLTGLEYPQAVAKQKQIENLFNSYNSGKSLTGDQMNELQEWGKLFFDKNSPVFNQGLDFYSDPRYKTLADNLHSIRKDSTTNELNINKLVNMNDKLTDQIKKQKTDHANKLQEQEKKYRRKIEKLKNTPWYNNPAAAAAAGGGATALGLGGLGTGTLLLHDLLSRPSSGNGRDGRGGVIVM